MFRKVSTKDIFSALRSNKIFLPTKKSLFFSTSSKNDNTVIIGMGPTGLAHALETLKKNQNVILVSDRDKFTRPQVLSLRENIFDYLEYLVGTSTMHSYLA